MFLFLIFVFSTTAAAIASRSDLCARHFFRGIPPQIGDEPIQGRTICKNDMAIIFDDIHKVPSIVAYSIRFQRSKTSVPAEGDWAPDEQIPREVQASDKDYTNSGYDRGHLAPAKTFSFSCEAETSTYTFANAAPQNPDSNKYVWIKTERFLRNYLSAHKTTSVHVLTGTFFSSKNLKTKTIGKGHVSVPDAYWTANWDASYVNTDGTRGMGWGFFVYNTQPKNHQAPTLRTIKEIEDATGISNLLTESTSWFANSEQTTEMANPKNRAAWEQDLLRAWNGNLPSNSEPTDALPETVERCLVICQQLEEVDIDVGISTCQTIKLTKADRHRCVQLVEQLSKPTSSKRRKQDTTNFLDLDLDLDLSQNCHTACKKITNPHAQFYVGKSSRKQYYSSNLLIGQVKDQRDEVMAAMNSATDQATPMNLAVFGALITEPVYGGLDNRLFLQAWPNCDTQLEFRKPMLEVNLGGRLLLPPIEFRGLLRDVKYKCAGFLIEGGKYFFGLITGSKRVVVLCERYSIKKWIEVFTYFQADGTAGGGGKLLLKNNIK